MRYQRSKACLKITINQQLEGPSVVHRAAHRNSASGEIILRIRAKYDVGES